MNETLEFLRENLDYTQKDMAEMLNITQSAYSKYENNILPIPLPQLNKISNILNASIDYIMELTRENKKTIKLDEIDYKLISTRITEFREDNNLSMRQLAKILNTSHSTISSYESGNTLIMTSFALELAKKYNMSLDWLIGKSNIKYIKPKKITKRH